jgi:hypothetical protein
VLPEPLRLLISAYATGELSPRRRAAAARLLRHSSEARRLLKDLRANRLRLRALCPPDLPADFSDRVVNTLPTRIPIIEPSVAIGARRSKRFSPTSQWAAVAAAILIAVGFATYLVASRPENPAQARRIPAVKPETKATEPVATAVGDNTETPEAPDPTVADAATARPRPKPAGPRVKPPSAPAPDPLGTAAPPLPPLTLILAPHVLTYTPRDFERPDVRQLTVDELAQGRAHHIDLFCRDLPRALERLQAAFKPKSVRLVGESTAQDHLKRKVRGQLMIFSDELTAAEWGQILQGLSAAERKTNDGTIDSYVVLPFDNADQKELAAAVGSERTQPDAKLRGGAGRATPNNPRSGAGSPTAFVALTNVFGRALTNPKDVRQYLDGRRDRSVDAISVLLLLRIPG